MEAPLHRQYTFDKIFALEEITNGCRYRPRRAESPKILARSRPYFDTTDGYVPPNKQWLDEERNSRKSCMHSIDFDATDGYTPPDIRWQDEKGNRRKFEIDLPKLQHYRRVRATRKKFVRRQGNSEKYGTSSSDFGATDDCVTPNMHWKDE